MVLAFLAWTVAASWDDHCNANWDIEYHEIGYGAFFVGAQVFVWLSEATLLVAYLFFMDALTSLNLNWWFVEMIFTSGLAFLTMLSSCLYADGIHDAKIDYESTSPPCDLKYSVLEFAVACGFFSMFALIAKCWYLFKELQTSGYLAIDAVQGSAGGEGGEEVTVSV